MYLFTVQVLENQDFLLVNVLELSGKMFYKNLMFLRKKYNLLGTTSVLKNSMQPKVMTSHVRQPLP